MADTTDKPKKGKPEKFLFNVHCFDEDHVEEPPPEEPPPPPVFSEEDLANARREAREHGRREASAEAQASREKHIADLLGRINASFQALFEAEAERSAQYEAEVLVVARAIFERLFPALNERHGLDELEQMIAATLESNREAGEIILEINSEYVAPIEDRLAGIRAQLHTKGNVSIRANDTLGPGDCRMIWQDGGASRDVSGLREEIHRQLEQLLAGKASLQDNRGGATPSVQEPSGTDAGPVTDGDEA